MIAREEIEKAFDARFSKEIQTKLQRSRVAIAGLGGLGSNIAVMLARSGVGELLLVDYDVVDVTNLNRQVYRIPHIGKPKTEALRSILAEINPYLNVMTLQKKVCKENVHEIFESYSLVCEAFDRADQKAMLINTLLVECPDTVVISGNGMAGYGDADEIHTVQRMKRLYVCGDEKTDIESGIGLFAPRVEICAGHQANKVLQLILAKK